MCDKRPTLDRRGATGMHDYAISRAVVLAYDSDSRLTGSVSTYIVIFCAAVRRWPLSRRPLILTAHFIWYDRFPPCRNNLHSRLCCGESR